MFIKQLFSNNAVSLLKTGISPSDTTLTVLPGHGDLFPTPQANEYFAVTLEDQAATVREIIHVTARSGDVFTVERGAEGTEALAWSATAGNDTLVDHRITADTLYRLDNEYLNLPDWPSLTSYKEALDYLLNGNPTSGGQAIDVDVTTAVDGLETVVSLPSAYKPNTTAVYIGGVRQKRGVDFLESGPAELRLQFTLTDEQIAEGQNVVVDYVVA